MNRGTEATLTRTIPRSWFKSSTKDLSLPKFGLVIRACPRRVRIRRGAAPNPCYDLDRLAPAYAYAPSYLGAHGTTAFQPGFGLRGVQP